MSRLTWPDLLRLLLSLQSGLLPLHLLLHRRGVLSLFRGEVSLSQWLKLQLAFASVL